MMRRGRECDGRLMGRYQPDIWVRFAFHGDRLCSLGRI